MPIKIPAIKHDGSKGILTFADGTKPTDIQAKLTELNAIQEKSWMDHAKDWAVAPPSWYNAEQTFGQRQVAVGQDIMSRVKGMVPSPNDPIGNLLYVSGFPLGGASGAAATKAAVAAGRPGLARLVSSGLTRVGLMTGAGAAGGEFEQLTKPEGDASTVAGGAFRGFITSLAGEGFTALANAGSRILMRNYLQMFKNPDEARMMVQRIMPEIAGTSKDPGHAFETLLGEVGRAKKSKYIEDSLTDAARQSVNPSIYLPELKAWLEAKGVSSQAAPNGMYTTRNAMDDYMRMGPAVDGYGDRQYQAAMLTKITNGLGAGATTFKNMLGKNALWEEMGRLFDPSQTPGLRTKWGGMDFEALQNKVIETFYGMGSQAKAARTRVGAHLDDIVQTIFRNEPAPFLSGTDTPGKFGAGISARFGIPHPYVHGMQTPQAVGKPGEMYPGTLTPATALGISNFVTPGESGEPSAADKMINAIPSSIQNIFNPPTP